MDVEKYLIINLNLIIFLMKLLEHMFVMMVIILYIVFHVFLNNLQLILDHLMIIQL